MSVSVWVWVCVCWCVLINLSSSFLGIVVFSLQLIWSLSLQTWEMKNQKIATSFLPLKLDEKLPISWLSWKSNRELQKKDLYLYSIVVYLQIC